MACRVMVYPAILLSSPCPPLARRMWFGKGEIKKSIRADLVAHLVATVTINASICPLETPGSR
jgi:hypothetical protein